jgi:Fic family protein
LTFPILGVYLWMEWKEIHIQSENLTDLLSRIDAQKQTLDQLRPLPSYVLQSIKESFVIEWTYNSNSIEGNTLSLNETKVVLEDGMTIKGKSLKEHLEVINHREAIEYIELLAKPDYQLHERDILATHALVLDKIEREIAGRFRTAGVRITGANFVPPNAIKIPELITDLINWTNGAGQNLHPLIRATMFHHRFVWLHPFFDGNGRTVRLLSNLLLMKDGYPPAIILRNDRKKYYDALNAANLGQYDKLALLCAQALERTLSIYLNALQDKSDDYLPIASLVSEPNAPYGQEYVSLLARTGKIQAYKEGRVWYTSKSAIDTHIEKLKLGRK